MENSVSIAASRKSHLSSAANSLLCEDIWYMIITFACQLPPITIDGPEQSGGVGVCSERRSITGPGGVTGYSSRWRELEARYIESMLEVNRRRKTIRSVCHAFFRILSRIRDFDDHIIIPGSRPTHIWIALQFHHPFSSPRACQRWTVRDMISNSSKLSIMEASWSRIVSLRQLDVELAPDFTEPLPDFTNNLYHAANDLLSRNHATIQSVHWYTPSVDIIPILRKNCATVQRLYVLVQNSYLNHSGWSPVKWSALRDLSIHHDFSPLPTRLLDVLSIDDMSSLESFTITSFVRVLGLDNFLTRNPNIKRMTLDTRIVLDNHMVPVCPSLEELEGRILPLIYLLRTTQPALRLIVLRGMYGHDINTARSRLVFQLDKLSAFLLEHDNTPALLEVRIHKLTEEMLNDGCWFRRDVRTVSRVVGRLSKMGVILQTSDYKTIPASRPIQDKTNIIH